MRGTEVKRSEWTEVEVVDHFGARARVPSTLGCWAPTWGSWIGDPDVIVALFLSFLLIFLEVGVGDTDELESEFEDPCRWVCDAQTISELELGGGEDGSDSPSASASSSPCPSLSHPASASAFGWFS